MCTTRSELLGAAFAPAAEADAAKDCDCCCWLRRMLLLLLCATLLCTLLAPLPPLRRRCRPRRPPDTELVALDADDDADDDDPDASRSDDMSRVVGLCSPGSQTPSSPSPVAPVSRALPWRRSLQTSRTWWAAGAGREWAQWAGPGCTSNPQDLLPHTH